MVRPAPPWKQDVDDHAHNLSRLMILIIMLIHSPKKVRPKLANLATVAT